jgi:arabinan endo-1,5-alpha-L-arabinosidase
MSSRKTAITPTLEPIEARRLPAPLAIVAQPIAAVLSPPGDPGAIAGVTDPSLIKQGNAYYLFSSGAGIEIRESADLMHWTPRGEVFDKVPARARAKVPGTSGIWAPDISFFDGEYHLYYAVSTFGGQRSVIGLATNTTLDPSAPGYKWVDRGEVVESRPGRDNFNAIDPNVVIDAGANVWLAFGSQWSGIKLLRLDPTTGLRAGGRLGKLVAIASRPRAEPIEAPFVFQRGGYDYLFTSFDRCCTGAASTYKIMVGRSVSVTGPYLDRSGRPMTRGGGTLVLAGAGRFHGPGSNAVLSVGDRAYLVYQAYDTWNKATPTLQIRPLSWTPDGWPVAGDPLFS